MPPAIAPLYALARHAARCWAESFDWPAHDSERIAAVLACALDSICQNRTDLHPEEYEAAALAQDALARVRFGTRAVPNLTRCGNSSSGRARSPGCNGPAHASGTCDTP